MAVLIFIVTLLCANTAWSYSECQRVLVKSVSQHDINVIVNTHNKLRSLIANGKVPGQPRATNIGNLTWDNALAREAQNIANTCVFEHVRVNNARFYVGQNLGKSWSSGPSNRADWRGTIQSWFNEYKDFKYPDTSNGVTGHYTQVVWADTKLIGCGYTHSFNNGLYEKLYVCNYGPGGNWVGQPPYKTG